VTFLRFPSVNFRQAAQGLIKPSNTPAAIVLVVVLMLGVFADYRNKEMLHQEQRADVLAEIGLIRARLEGNINANMHLVQGLVSTLSTEPEMSQQRFAELADELFNHPSQLRVIAGAPNLVVSLIYPVEGNEPVLGLDYRENEQQREAALRVRDTGQPVLAGPVDLVQGGRAFVGRFPVYARGADGRPNFWGILSAVIDADSLYLDSGLLDVDLPVHIALSGADGLGTNGAQFFGSKWVMANDPVAAEIMLPSGGRWQIAAVPKAGWGAARKDVLIFRVGVLLAGILILAPLLISARLTKERQRHIEELRSREADLERLSHRLELAIDVSQIGVWEVDLESQEILWDNRVNELYGMEKDGGPRTIEDWIRAVHPDDLERAEEEFRVAVEGMKRYSSEYRVVLPDGQIRNLRARAAIYKEIDGPLKMLGAEWDVTEDVALNQALGRARDLAERRYAELEAAKARIEHDSLHDALTGLPNRRYLDEVLKQRICAGGETAAILQIDLDRFKQINDTLGHAAGDAMLIHAASVLQANIGKEAFVARTGGDEFVVFCTASGPEFLAALAGRIIEQMRRPVPYQGHECRFGVSVGIASTYGADFDLKRLLVNADIALHRAKSRGRNRFEFFTGELQADIVRTKRIADEILSGLEQEEFVPHYQPQFDAETLDVIGVEALARWNHPSGVVRAPDYFLKVAEELNVVAAIDRTVLEQALRDSASWRARGIVVPKISVNVSARRLRDEELIESLRGLSFASGTVSFELVESIFLDESDDVIVSNIEQIKKIGLDIEIDDFGSGHASIVSLLKLKPQRLKIDRQLVMPIVGSPSHRQLVASIIEIGKSLDIEVIAEGVETMDHARILRDLGCRGLQGFAFARAMISEDFAGFVQSQTWRSAS
jgi:diguanylate cyclase (GGDEF)-like protein